MKEIYKFEKNQSLRLTMTCSQLRGISKNTQIIKDSGPWVWKQFLKEKTKTWYCDKCPCSLCETYIANVGFVLCNLFNLKLDSW